MNDTDPIAPTSGSPICTPTPPGASGEMRNAPLDTSEDGGLHVAAFDDPVWAAPLTDEQMDFMQRVVRTALAKRLSKQGHPPKLASVVLSDGGREAKPKE